MDKYNVLEAKVDVLAEKVTADLPRWNVASNLWKRVSAAVTEDIVELKSDMSEVKVRLSGVENKVEGLTSEVGE